MAYETASNQRKELIASTLKELLQTKPLSKISVTELVQQCRINRKTFYYHFEDIYALLKWMLEREIIEMLRQYDLLSDYDAALDLHLIILAKTIPCCAIFIIPWRWNICGGSFFHASGK